jgi:hypothetical protein
MGGRSDSSRTVPLPIFLSPQRVRALLGKMTLQGDLLKEAKISPFSSSVQSWRRRRAALAFAELIQHEQTAALWLLLRSGRPCRLDVLAQIFAEKAFLIGNLAGARYPAG